MIEPAIRQAEAGTTGDATVAARGVARRAGRRQRLMPAIVKAQAGPGLEMCEVPIPAIGPHDVLVKVRACSICGTDLHIDRWDGAAAGWVKPPMVIGHEMCGYVVERGSAVTRVKEGDFVSPDSHLPDWTCDVCRRGAPHLCANLQILGLDRPGAYAEYVSLPESILWTNSPDLDPAAASIQDPMGNAVYATLVEPVAEQSVVVFGDGPTGLGAVAVAKASGAASVIHVGLSPFLLDIGRRLGADVSLNAGDPHVDVVAEVRERCGSGADVVLEMSGSAKAIRQGLAALRPGGRYSAFGLPSQATDIDWQHEVIFKGTRILGVTGRLLWDTWQQMAALLRSGRLDFSPIVTHRLPFSEFRHGFDLLEAADRRAAKVVLYMDEAELP
jgi:threonine 3-dehydrogenase